MCFNGFVLWNYYFLIIIFIFCPAGWVYPASPGSIIKFSPRTQALQTKKKIVTVNATVTVTVTATVTVNWTVKRRVKWTTEMRNAERLLILLANIVRIQPPPSPSFPPAPKKKNKYVWCGKASELRGFVAVNETV